MKRKTIFAALLAIVMAFVALAQNTTSKPPETANLTDQQRIERLERQVASLQERLGALEQQSKPHLENSK